MLGVDFVPTGLIFEGGTSRFEIGFQGGTESDETVLASAIPELMMRGVAVYFRSEEQPVASCGNGLLVRRMGEVVRRSKQDEGIEGQSRSNYFPE